MALPCHGLADLLGPLRHLPQHPACSTRRSRPCTPDLLHEAYASPVEPQLDGEACYTAKRREEDGERRSGEARRTHRVHEVYVALLHKFRHICRMLPELSALGEFGVAPLTFLFWLCLMRPVQWCAVSICCTLQ